MKKINIYYLIILFLVTGVYSCEEDFLERTPLDAMSDEAFFNTTSDLKNYMNGMYGGILPDVRDNRWRSLEDGSDNFIADAPNSSIMRHSVTGEAPATDGNWNYGYDYIRQVNYFLENAVRVPEDAQSKHYVGEAYYARANMYAWFLNAYGGVPYIDAVLHIDSEELYKVRESRDFIAGKIIEDLDKAIEVLDWKGEGEAGPQRVNKQAALLLKSRIGLYEGSWEYYHGSKGTPFAVSGKTGTEFLNSAIDAAEMLINHEGDNLFQGRTDWEYFDLFIQIECSTTPGVYLYDGYSRQAEYNIYNQYADKIKTGSFGGVTKAVLDNYLMKDGNPSEISGIALDELSLASYGINKDPRLRQTVYTPDRGLYGSYFPEGADFNTRYTGINNQDQERHAGAGGIKVWKGQSFDPLEWRDGQTDNIVMRYAEVLLNYAEAKAILGTLNQADLDKSVNLLRDRVNMPPMIMGDINGWAVTYSEQDGYDPAASNIINEIRRERRVEFMLEGYRHDDIKRWALLGEIFNGEIFYGAPAKEISDYWNNGAGLVADGWAASDTNKVKMILGQHYDVDPSGNFINPFYLNSDFLPGGRGYFIDPARDYLSGIPKDEIDLYSEKGGVTLEQNPGWF